MPHRNPSASSEISTYVSPQSWRVRCSIQDAVPIVPHLRCCNVLLTLSQLGLRYTCQGHKGPFAPCTPCTCTAAQARAPEHAHSAHGTEGSCAAPRAQRSPATGWQLLRHREQSCAPVLPAFPADVPLHPPHRTMRERPWQLTASSLHAMSWPPGAGKPCSWRSILHGLLQSVLSAAHLVPLWLQIHISAACLQPTRIPAMPRPMSVRTLCTGPMSALMCACPHCVAKRHRPAKP